MKQLAWKQRLVERYRLLGIAGPRMMFGPVILMYHGVVESDGDAELNRWNITLRELARHIRFITEEFDVISLDAVVDAIERGDDLPKNAIVITFDDALANVFHRARPMLMERALPYVVAAPAGLVESNRTVWSQEIRLIILHSQCKSIEVLSRGGAYTWLLDSRSARLHAERQIEQLFRNEEPSFREKALEHLVAQLPAGEFDRLLERHRELRIMSFSQLRQLRDDGVTIAAHGWFHTPLKDGIENSILQREIADAKKQLEKILECPVDHFVFPHGQCSSASIEMLRKVGFRSGLTTRAGCVQPRSDAYMLPRIAAECTLPHLRHQLLRLCA